MNSLLESIMGMDVMTDQVIATDLLISAKAGVINYSIAVTEATTPEVRSVLRHQLKEAIELHGEVSQYMISKGWYHPFDANEQIQLDLKTGKTALNVADPGPGSYIIP